MNRGKVIVVGPRDHIEGYRGIHVDTTSKGGQWSGLSPFLIGPCDLYDGHVSKNMENGWQYAKVYAEHTGHPVANPTEKYWDWAKQGWSNPKAVRYPMGKGIVPLYSLWQGEHLAYLEARRRVYLPLYRDAVKKTAAWAALRVLHEAGEDVVLWDFDGRATHESLREVLSNSKKKMGHAFVLKMMLLYGEDVRDEDLPWKSDKE